MLADAYAGRARSLAAKGMFDEAETALNKTAAADGTVREPLLYVQCLAKRGQLGKAFQHAVKYIGTDKVPAASAARMAELTAPCGWSPRFVSTLKRTPAPSSANGPESAAAAQQSLAAWVEGKPAHEIEPLLTGFRCGPRSDRCGSFSRASSRRPLIRHGRVNCSTASGTIRPSLAGAMRSRRLCRKMRRVSDERRYAQPGANFVRRGGQGPAGQANRNCSPASSS